MPPHPLHVVVQAPHDVHATLQAVVHAPHPVQPLVHSSLHPLHVLIHVIMQRPEHAERHDMAPFLSVLSGFEVASISSL